MGQGQTAGHLTGINGGVKIVNGSATGHFLGVTAVDGANATVTAPHAERAAASSGARAALGAAPRLGEPLLLSTTELQDPNRLAPPVVRGEIRRCLVHRLPFSILYRVVANGKIRILVIRHHKRRGSFGMGRR